MTADVHGGVQARERFEAAGGHVLDFTAVEGVTVHPEGVALRLPDPHRPRVLYP